MDMRSRKPMGNGFRTSSSQVGSLRPAEQMVSEENQAVKTVAILSHRRGLTKDEFLQVVSKLGLGEALERVRERSELSQRSLRA